MATAGSESPPGRGAAASYADLDAFVADQGQALVRYAWLLTRGDEALSQDLVQGALVRLFEHGFERVRHPRAFTRRLMTTQHLDLARHQGVQQRAAPLLHVEERGEDVAVGAVDDRHAILDAMGDLSERERTVVVLRYYEDHDDAEIADILGCTRSTVRSLARRGLRRLRSRMEEDR